MSYHVAEGRVSYLLGAGASANAGLPLAAGLLDGLLVELKRRGEETGDAQPFKSLSYLVEIYSDYLKTLTRGKIVRPDIETIISAIEMLANQDDLEIRPLLQEVSAKTPITLLSGQSIPVHSLLDFNRQQEYYLLLHECRRILRDLLAISEDAHVRYLYPLVRLASNADVTVGSLNYDMTVEKAAKELGVAVSDGIERWSKDWMLEWPSPGLRLMKLHGSLDWEDEFEAPSDLDPGGSIIGSSRGSGPNSYPYIVFGRREKLKTNGPFLDLRAQFIEDLRSTSYLVVVGYSFSDDHVNEIIRHWLRVDLERILVVVDPDLPETYFEDGAPFLRHFLMTLQQQDGPFVGRNTYSRMLRLKMGFEDATSIVCGGSSLIDAALLIQNPLMRMPSQ
jgi:hypothetical protein